MSRLAHCLINVPHERPGLLGQLLNERGWEVRETELHRGDPLPDRATSGELLVVLGGPMGVADIGDPAFPWLGPVARLLARRLADGAPSLGICLGSQLLAHASGARVAPMRDAAGRPVREVGWMPIQLARPDPVFDGITGDFDVLHWHGDAAELPTGATLLASTPACRNQMYRIGRSLGLQFHLEADGPCAVDWTRRDPAYVEGANGPGSHRALAAASAAAAAASEPARRRLLGNILDELGGR